MNELVSKAFPDAAAEGMASDAVSGVGGRLRAAREARGLSVADVAGLLKLTQRQVAAIEADDWERLPGQTFARGFLRNYARLLQLDADALLTELDSSLAPEPVNIELARTASGELPRQGQVKRRDLLAVSGAVGMVLVALGIYFLLPDNFWQRTVEPLLVSKPAVLAEGGSDKVSGDETMPPEPAEVRTSPPAVATAEEHQANQPSVPAALNATSATTAAPAIEKAASPSIASGGGGLPAVDAVAPASAANQENSASSATGKLNFEFAKASWVEVKDKTGKILLSQLQPAGSQKELAGTPPFTLVVGNASNVKVFYNGKPLLLTPNEASNVARLSVQ